MSQGLAMIMIGIWGLFYALWVAKVRRYILNNGISVKGVIFKIQSDGEGGVLSVYEFSTESGKVITGCFLIANRGGETGDAVNVLYHPKYPKTFLVEEYLPSPKTYVIVKIVVGAGIIFLLALGYWVFPK